MGIEWELFDIHDFRGEPLRAKLESFLSKGDIAAVVYSNPNNPAWICLEESELKIIGELATQYDVIVLEDQAYFCMDFVMRSAVLTSSFCTYGRTLYR